MINWIFPFFLIFFSGGKTVVPNGPEQPEEGPGGISYEFENVVFHDFASDETGYWLFKPEAATTDSLHVIVFLHGYGAINPMIYGAWIKHLVKRGNIVVFPRYQKNIYRPRPPKFVANAVVGIKKALQNLKEEGYPVHTRLSVDYIGHSYGGTIAANIANRHEELGLAAPKNILLCAPGTGPFKGGLLDDYSNIPSTTNLQIVVSIHDHVVGEKLGRKIFQTAVHTPRRNLVRLMPDEYGNPELASGHNECYGLDAEFDSGLRNVSTRRAMYTSVINAADYYAYWRLFDAMQACEENGTYCDIAWGNTAEQRNMGQWSDGQKLSELEVWLPEDAANLD